MALDVPILVTQVPVAPGQTATATRPTSPLMLPGEGGRIIAVAPDGSQRLLTEGFQSAADPSLSFDATRFVFAGKRVATDLWNIYEYSLDTGQARQVTRDVGNCRQPSYQSKLFTVDSPEPWFQLTFVSDAGLWLNEDGCGVSHSLYSCRLDGSQVRRLTYNLSDDADPFLMGDGRLLYASWQRATLDRGPAGRVALFGINIEGTDNALFGDSAGKRIKRMPCITDRGLVLFIECDEGSADSAGQIGSVTFRRPLKSYRSVTSESEGFAYRAPAPWSQGHVLVSRRPLDRSKSWGTFIFDPKTVQCQPVIDDPAYDEIQAVAVRDIRLPDGRSTVVNDAEPLAKMYCLNVQVNDLPDANWLPPGTVKRIRVLEGVPAPYSWAALRKFRPADRRPQDPVVRRSTAGLPSPSGGCWVKPRSNLMDRSRSAFRRTRRFNCRRWTRTAWLCGRAAGSGPRTSNRGAALAATKTASPRPRMRLSTG